MILAGAGIVLLGLSIWLIATFMTSNVPRLNESTIVLAKFAATKQYDSLSFDQQRQYMKVLEKREQDLDKAFEQHQISESEFRNALEQAWLGKHLSRVENFRGLAPGQPRIEYLAKLLDKKVDKERKHPHTSTANEIKVDESAAEARVESWPPDIRAQWQMFHAAYHDAKKAREKAEKQAAKSPPTKPGGS